MSDEELKVKKAIWQEPTKEQCEELGRLIFGTCLGLINEDYKGMSRMLPLTLPDGLQTRVVVNRPHWFDSWTAENGERQTEYVYPKDVVLVRKRTSGVEI